MGIQERIQEIENEMARTQKNKKTEHHLGALKAKLAKYKAELAIPKSQTNKCDGWEVSKSGDARVALIGLPSVGKSTLLSKITNTESKAAAHEFTTIDCISGKLEYNGASIQILDLPGIISGASSNLGRGRQVISTARTADLVVMVLDPRRKKDRAVLERELYNMGIRLNKKRPDVSFSVTSSGGISINKKHPLTKTTEKTIEGILKEYRISNCQMYIKCDVSDEDIIDLLNPNTVYIDCIYCYNKIDELSYADFLKIDFDEFTVPISCSRNWNIDGFIQEIWRCLKLTRVYTKKKGGPPDLERPVILRGNSSVLDLCQSIHKDFSVDFKYAMVWGISAKHSPQKVGLSHILSDEDVVQISTK